MTQVKNSITSLIGLADIDITTAPTTGAKAIDAIGSAVNTPLDQRKGKVSRVYFTRDVSAQGLVKIFKKISRHLDGKVAIKLHTGEKNGPNIVPAAWVKELIKEIPNATIVETNTYYEGDRYTTRRHRETLKVNGWDFAPVDIMDAKGKVRLPVKGGKWFKEMSMGASITDYDSMLVLTHFKGHTMGGFGGSCKNIGIGCADGRIGKKWIHTGATGEQWGIDKDEFMERMTESAKAVLDHFGKNIVFINVMRKMSVSCDCEGLAAEPVVTPDVGILASTDILAIDQASVDLIFAMGRKSVALRRRIETRRGLRQLSYMRELKMGSDNYKLIELQ